MKVVYVVFIAVLLIGYYGSSSAEFVSHGAVFDYSTYLQQCTDLAVDKMTELMSNASGIQVTVDVITSIGGVSFSLGGQISPKWH